MVDDAQLREHVQRLIPGARVIELAPLGPDEGATAASTAGATAKAAGYGLPLRIVVEDPSGARRALVWRVASANAFGHDRRADRAAGMIQAFDDFAQIPRHVQALDLGVIRASGALQSTRDATEHYLITAFAPGSVYAQDLRRIAAEGRATPRDLARVGVLARYLAGLHAPIGAGAVRYRRAIRDLVGSGEGIAGIIDGYPEGVPAASAARLAAIEGRCLGWRWRLRDRADRLVRTHGDFHPFNLVFEGDDLHVLDASRGACGDAADDLTALAINYLLFALDVPTAWHGGMGPLWRALWRDYLTARPDRELLDVAPPFFAWRALVVCNPVFYPRMSERARDRLLGFATDVLDAHRLAPAAAEALFA